MPVTRDLTSGDRPSVYRIYGVTLASNFPFLAPLVKGDGAPDVTFRLAHGPPVAEPDKDTHIFKGRWGLCVYHQRDFQVMHYAEDSIEYHLWPQDIICHLLRPAQGYLWEVYLLGPVLSVWLELQGIPALHASAVAVEDHAVGFLATSTGGKSTLAATMLQAGYPLLTDDILCVERREEAFWGRPGFPQMRLWPDQARYFLGHYEEFDIVHPYTWKRRVPVGENGLGTFCSASRPLACLYLPERRDPTTWGTRVEVTPVSRVEALVSLIGQGFSSSVVEKLGLRRHRFDLFGSLASQVPIYRLVYPEGVQYLPYVRQAILDSLTSLSPPEERVG